MNKKIESIGLDIGYGDVKAAVIRNGKLQTTVFPAVLGHAQNFSSFTTGLGAPARLRATRIRSIL